MKYRKLVRDRIPEILDEKGIEHESWVADPDEYRRELIRKFREEADEFLADKSVGELADVLEVIKALETLDEFACLETVRQVKKAERGGFAGRIMAAGER